MAGLSEKLTSCYYFKNKGEKSEKRKRKKKVVLLTLPMKCYRHDCKEKNNEHHMYYLLLEF